MPFQPPPSFQRVLCFVPPTGRYIREDRCQTPIEHLKTVALRPPIELLYAAAAFEGADCRVRLRDYPAEGGVWADFERDLAEFQPDAVLMHVTTPSLARDLESAAVAHRVDPKIVTLAKGAHFNTLDVETMERFPHLDGALRGEGEQICRELGEGRPPETIDSLTWRDAEGTIHRNPDRPFEDDLDRLAFPARHLIHNERYRRPDTGRMQTTLVTNRGCPYRCVYCLSHQVAGGRNRYRSVANVMAEIRECVERHGIHDFLMRSDLFTQDAAWVVELCRAIVESGLKIEWACNSRVDTLEPEMLGWMKRAGCWIVALGVESGDQATLDRIGKHARVEQAFDAVRLCRRAGLRSSVYLLMGLPWDTRESIERQSAFARRLDPDFLEIFYVYPFPGTPLYEMCVADGLLAEGEIPKEAYGAPALPTRHLTIEELSQLRRRAMRRFYLRPRVVARTLLGARSPGELLNYLRAGWTQLKDLLGK